MSRSPLPFAAVFFLAAATLVPTASAVGGFSFEKLALEGDPAPGTEAGTVFAFTNGYLPVIPRLAADGQVAFVASLAGPYVDDTNDVGVWTRTPGGELTLIARAGDPVPGAGPGITFANFPLDFAILSPEAGSGSVGIIASVTGTGVTTSNDLGVWKHSGQQLTMLAREGEPVTGAGPGLYFREPFGLEVSADGDLSLRASLSGTGVDTDNDEGFWTDRDGVLTGFLREGDPVPDLPAGIVIGGAGEFIGTGYTFESPQFNDVSRFALQANVTGTGVTTFDNEVLWRELNGELHLLAREGDPAPGAGAGVNYGGNGVTVAFSAVSYNSLGQSAFTSRLGGAVETSTAMFSDHTGTLAPVLMPGALAPGTNDVFGVFGWPLLGESGRIAFRSSLAGDGPYPPFGIWWDQPGAIGELQALILPNQPLPSDPSITVLGTSFLLGFNSSGQLAFQASFDDATHGFRQAVLLAQPDGSIDVVLDAALPFDVHGDGSEYRSISDFDVGGLDESGTISLRIDFSDGTFGFFTAGSGPATSAPVATAAAHGFRLAPVSPNPFRNEAGTWFDLPRRSHVTVDVLDVTGRRVSRLLEGSREAGRHPVLWDGRDAEGRLVGSGVYFLRAATESSVESRKIVRLE